MAAAGIPAAGDPPSIGVIDTGICNLRSVTKALEAVGAAVRVVRSPAEVAAAAPRGLVLPGVGALRDCVASLRASGLDAVVRDWIKADRPFLGVCLGMQALFEHSEEGDISGLGIFPGKVVRFRLPAGFKVPHMGWNTVRFTQAGSPLAAGLAEEGESFISCTVSAACPRIRRWCSRNAITAGSSARRSAGAGFSRPSSIPRRVRRRDCGSTRTSSPALKIPFPGERFC